MGARMRRVIAFGCEGATLVGTLDLPGPCFDELSTNGGEGSTAPTVHPAPEKRAPAARIFSEGKPALTSARPEHVDGRVPSAQGTNGVERRAITPVRPDPVEGLGPTAPDTFGVDRTASPPPVRPELVEGRVDAALDTSGPGRAPLPTTVRPEPVEGRIPATALLIVSGGNETRSGAHRGMALLAARLAAEGTPVFRYDRRGTGDSEGENLGYAQAAPDLRAAAAAFREYLPAGTRLIAFGNCDAATLLATEARAAGIDAVILANPWTVEDADPLPPAAAIRAGYAAKLRDAREWWRLLRGGVDLRKLLRGLAKIARPPAQSAALAQRTHAAIARWGDAATVVLAQGDATAIAYAAGTTGVRPHTVTIPTASHSFARAADQQALEAAIRAAIRRLP